MSKKRRIALLLAGGTHILDKQDRLLTVDQESDINFWLEQMPELNIMVDIEPVFVGGENKSVDAHTGENIIKNIVELEKKVDAFIVITKLEHLIDISLALSYGLQNFAKTIITTSSQIYTNDFKDKKSCLSKLKAKNTIGLKSNLINALQASESQLPTPAIMFGTRLIQSSTAIWDFRAGVDFLASVDNEYWGKVDFGINIKDNFVFKNNKADIYDKLFAEILVIENINGVEWNFSQDIFNNYKAVLVKVPRGQDIEDNKKQQILDWNIPTVLYNVDIDLPSDKVASITNCTWNVALIKTMWVIANIDKIENFKKGIAADYIGEFNI